MSKECDLEPCPCCGEQAFVNQSEHLGEGVIAHCCGCQLQIERETESDAVDAWNHRIPTSLEEREL